MARSERNCQIRMSTSLWNLIGTIAQEAGNSDARGRHSAVIREMLSAAAANWTFSPYICRSARHIVFVTSEGNIFHRQVQLLRLNTHREKIPTIVQMKPEKHEYYLRRFREMAPSREIASDETDWLRYQWLVNYFSIWNGKLDPDDYEAFRQRPLSSACDTLGGSFKAADLPVHALNGRFLTRESIIGLRDYVEWKETNTPIFDRIDIPIEIPTVNMDVFVVADLNLFQHSSVEVEEIANLALEFRNGESARFEGREVGLYTEVGFEELIGRSPNDEGSDEMFRQVRRLRQRIATLLEDDSQGERVSDSDKKAILTSLRLPQNFLFYWLRWPTPHLGIRVCVRWEKPVRPAFEA